MAPFKNINVQLSPVAPYNNAEAGVAERCRVLVRFRPLPDSNHSESPFMIRDDARVSVAPKDCCTSDQSTYQFDRIFSPDATQEEVFQVVMKDSVDSVLNGFNATVLAYGQSGAGKTHTMFGTEKSGQGIIPRSVKEIFRRIASHDSGSVFVVKVVGGNRFSCRRRTRGEWGREILLHDYHAAQASMLEIYMEEMRDLLRPSASKCVPREAFCFPVTLFLGLHYTFIHSAEVGAPVVSLLAPFPSAPLLPILLSLP
eukprot:762672-Hanusia_phi.AAC.2